MVIILLSVKMKEFRPTVCVGVICLANVIKIAWSRVGKVINACICVVSSIRRHTTIKRPPDLSGGPWKLEIKLSIYLLLV